MMKYLTRPATPKEKDNTEVMLIMEKSKQRMNL